VVTRSLHEASSLPVVEHEPVVWSNFVIVTFAFAANEVPSSKVSVAIDFF